MLQPRIPSREASLNSLASALNQLSLCTRHAPKTHPPHLLFTRHASHAAQGRANGPKDSAGRRLGAKKSQSEWVIPGDIIFKQRGTKWFPGENVGIGKDHTIFAKVAGYVRYYRNPALHPKRRYIGVALEKEGQGSTLPSPPNAPTRRRLGMYEAPIAPMPTPIDASSSVPLAPAQPTPDFSSARGHLRPFDPANTTRRGGHGISDWEIGRAAEAAGVRVKVFDRKDRWTAWRVRSKKTKAKMQEIASKKLAKGKGKKSSKKAVKAAVPA